MTHAFDPTRRPLVLDDLRLARIMRDEPLRCATVSEYAAAAGMATEDVLRLLEPVLSDGTVELEYVDREWFVHTAPEGRPAPAHHADVPANLWEHLRSRAEPDTAFMLWRVYRALERAGWAVEAQPHRIAFTLGDTADAPSLGVLVGSTVVPVLLFPPADALSSPGGLLTYFAHTGAPCVAVTCDNSALDDMVTATRRWLLARRGMTAMSVLLLEAPRYQPVLLSPADASVQPRAVTQASLGSQAWVGPQAGEGSRLRIGLDPNR